MGNVVCMPNIVADKSGNTGNNSNSKDNYQFFCENGSLGQSHIIIIQ